MVGGADLNSRPPALVGLSPGDLIPGLAETFLGACSQAYHAGLRGLALREPLLEDAALLQLALSIRSAAPELYLVLCDRVHLVRPAGAHGVQLAHHSLQASEASGLVPQGTWMGISDHQGAHARDLTGAHGRTLAPFKRVAGKGDPIGMEGLSNALEGSMIPTWALGGVVASDLPELRKAGVAGAWIRTAMTWDSRPGQAYEALHRAWESVA